MKQESKSIWKRLSDWYHKGRKREEIEAMNAAFWKAHEPQRPNEYTRRKAKEEAQRRRDNA